MKIMKFEGATMRDAIAKVKAELGDQAVIVSTRQVRKGLLGTAIEISAAIDEGDSDDATPSPTQTGRAPTLMGTGRGGFLNSYGGGPVRNEPAPGASPEDIEKVLAPLRSELRSLRALVRAGSDTKNTSTNDLKTELTALRRLVEDIRNTPATAKVAQAMSLTPTARALTNMGGWDDERTPAPASSIDAAIASVNIDMDVDVDDLDAEPARHAPPANRSRSSTVVSHDAPLTMGTTAKVIMLVGPTGCGKTTTIAKLAARAALIDERRTSLVTLDNFRVGGVDQIKTFADLIGIPLRTCEVADVISAIDPNDDLTLIDTAGRSPRDISAIAELASAITGHGIEVHLVIPAATPAAIIDDIVERHRAVSPARILFTKLDEVDVAPELARAPARTGLPISWITTGQAVPEDIEEPTSSRVLELASVGIAPIATTRTRAA